MTVKRFILTMVLTTIICWVAVGLILWNVDPTLAPFVGFLLFYIAVFFAIWGTFSIVGVALRKLVWKHEPPFTYVGTSLRQAFWFAILICLTLFLLSQNLFDWWMSIPLIIGFVSVEAFFLSHAQSQSKGRTGSGWRQKQRAPRTIDETFLSS